ncbi:aspartic protease [Thozetella sp. PMI_491]|nr:aspartic protease [Thozetella sp. PMI_491]
MLNLPLLAWWLLSLGSANAAPAHPDEIGLAQGSFSLTQVHNPSHIRNGPLAYYKALEKFGATIPDHLKTVVQRSIIARKTGSAKATPGENDNEYVLPVSIGNPPQKFRVQLDCGSSDFLVLGSGVSDNGDTEYRPEKSTTAKKLSGATWKTTYQDGTFVSGDVYMDQVAIGGLPLFQQAIQRANSISDNFFGDTEATLGLAFSNINTIKPQKQKTFFENVVGYLDKPVWTADLQHQAPGEINFGFIDFNSYYGDTITYTNVDTDGTGFWDFTATGYSIGSKKAVTVNIDGMVDTGTPILLLNKDVVSAYYKTIPQAKYLQAEGVWVFPCQTDLTDFSLLIEGVQFTVPGEYMNYSLAQDGVRCFGGIQSNADIGYSIFGLVALKAWFVVFDVGKQQIGFAPKKLLELEN